MSELDRFLRLRDVASLTGLSRSTIYRLEASNKAFPKRVKLSERATAWREAQIRAWMASRPQAAA